MLLAERQVRAIPSPGIHRVHNDTLLGVSDGHRGPDIALVYLRAHCAWQNLSSRGIRSMMLRSSRGQVDNDLDTSIGRVP